MPLLDPASVWSEPSRCPHVEMHAKVGQAALDAGADLL